MWKKIVLSWYIILMVASVMGNVIGFLGFPGPTHILLIVVSGLLFSVATILQFKLVHMHKADTCIYELELENKELKTARKHDRKELDEMTQKLENFIKTRFSDLPEKDIFNYVEALETYPVRMGIAEKMKSLPWLKKYL